MKTSSPHIDSLIIVITLVHPRPQIIILISLCICPKVATVLPPVQVTDVTARSFIIRWVRIPCEDLHGDFTAYRYFVTNNKSAEQTSSYIYDIDVTTERLMYRTPCSPYDIQMTLYNDWGVGDRSENVRVTTDAEGRSPAFKRSFSNYSTSYDKNLLG